MEKIIIPHRFEKKLNNSDTNYNSIIYEFLSHYENILNVSKLEFFPEYNDHGIKHLNNIFKIQNELIPDTSYSLLTPDDITTLIVATISHDIGMHINHEGFFTLLNSDLPHSQKWKEKWTKFFFQAKKYNESKLVSIFGDSIPILELPDNKQDFTLKHYLLIGEFIRINHPELAEDIILNGFPIANGKFIPLSQSFKKTKMWELTGLLSKSHGMDIRDTFSEIQKIGREGDLLNPFNIHIVYLMVILRLSDYLDIYENRNLKIILGLKNFISNISKFEWNKNTSVTEVKDHWKDEEAIFIGVEPLDSNSYLNLKNLFKSIQFELDMSWATLGEVYSKDNKLKILGIKYRRILSDLENVKYREKINYVPRKVAFDSDPELLKLLIAPLYGEDPSYAIRELLQNSIDACKERLFFTNNEEYLPQISIKLYSANSKYFFEIIDNGWGMNEDTIIDYFLKAGASFRNSEFWSENLKDNNTTKVIRTGRFGVGLLAVFLLGKEIEVKTKNFQLNIGYKFKTCLTDSQINMIKDNNIDIGTSIKINISENTYKLLKSDKYYEKFYDSNRYFLLTETIYDWQKWYLFNDIDVNYYINNKNTIFKDTIDVSKYIRIKQDDFTSVRWNYEKNKQICVCNGFIIKNGHIKLKSSIDIPSTNENLYIHKRNNFNTPSFSIIDKEGKLPLSLSRDKFLYETFSFNDSVIKSISDEIFSFLINFKISKKELLKNTYLNHPSLKENYWKSDAINYVTNLEKRFVFNKKGFNLMNSFSIEKNKIDKLIFIEFQENNFKKYNELVTNLLNNNPNTYFVFSCGGLTSISSGWSILLKELETGYLSLDKLFRIKSANIILQKNIYEKLFSYKNGYLTTGLKDEITTKNVESKKYKKAIPFYEDSKKLVKVFYKEKNESIFILNEIEKEFEEIGLIIELYIDSQSGEELPKEYYFYEKMNNFFKENKWISFCE